MRTGSQSDARVINYIQYSSLVMIVFIANSRTVSLFCTDLYRFHGSSLCVFEDKAYRVNILLRAIGISTFMVYIRMGIKQRCYTHLPHNNEYR